MGRGSSRVRRRRRPLSRNPYFFKNELLLINIIILRGPRLFVSFVLSCLVLLCSSTRPRFPGRVGSPGRESGPSSPGARGESRAGVRTLDSRARVGSPPSRVRGGSRGTRASTDSRGGSRGSGPGRECGRSSPGARAERSPGRESGVPPPECGAGVEGPGRVGTPAAGVEGLVPARGGSPGRECGRSSPGARGESRARVRTLESRREGGVPGGSPDPRLPGASRESPLQSAGRESRVWSCVRDEESWKKKKGGGCRGSGSACGMRNREGKKKKKKEKKREGVGMQHRDFPGGHPSQYYSGPKALNFRVLMGSGVVALV